MSWTLAFNTKGPQGAAGSQISFGTASQYSSLTSSNGANGDCFFTTDTNYFYQKTGGSWPSANSGTLLKGAMGVTGVSGASFYSGASAPTSSSPANANDGDLYLNLVGGEIYKHVSGSWQDQGYSIQGPQGTPGNKIYHGAGAPSNTGSYNSGDVYYDTNLGDVYFF